MNRTVKKISTGVAALVLVLGAAAASHAANGPGALYVAGATHTPTHWNIPIGVATAAEIRGVGSEVGSPLPATITVIVKSSVFGNTTRVGTRIGVTNNYSFTYTPPSIAHGDGFDACATTIVAYVSNGQNSCNDILDDGLVNGSSGSACGFRFVNGAGQPLDCIQVGVAPSPWSQVKALYN